MFTTSAAVFCILVCRFLKFIYVYPGVPSYAVADDAPSVLLLGELPNYLNI